MKVSLYIHAPDDKKQKSIEDLLTEIKREFPKAEITTTIKEEKIIPEEALLQIGLVVSAEVLIRILDKLWKHFAEKEIKVEQNTGDLAQVKAEEYLKHRQLNNFKIIKREDKGLYVYLIYEINGFRHRFHISKSDLEIIKYEERRSA